MTIIGFSFTKMLIERKKPVQGKINIGNNVKIINAEESKLSLDPNKAAAKFYFHFVSKYEPGVAEIELKGELTYLDSKEKVKTMLQSWKKDKKLPPALMTNILNNILAKCNVQALVMSRDMNLPAPIPLPKVAKTK
jgi:hypothetical protein